MRAKVAEVDHYLDISINDRPNVRCKPGAGCAASGKEKAIGKSNARADCIQKHQSNVIILSQNKFVPRAMSSARALGMQRVASTACTQVQRKKAM